jgi:hypothetical protein
MSCYFIFLSIRSSSCHYYPLDYRGSCLSFIQTSLGWRRSSPSSTSSALDYYRNQQNGIVQFTDFSCFEQSFRLLFNSYANRLAGSRDDGCLLQLISSVTMYSPRRLPASLGVTVASASINGFVKADRHSSHVTIIAKHYSTHLNRLHDFPPAGLILAFRFLPSFVISFQLFSLFIFKYHSTI